MAIAPYLRRFAPRLWFFFRFQRYWYWKGENEIHALRQFVPPGRMAIDIGSSIGFYTRALARLLPKVVAFEANPEVAALARSVAARNVEVINVALSDRNGRATLRVPLSGRGRAINELATIERGGEFGHVTFDVETKRLDDFGFTDCGFIKIDVEAHEEAVLDGAARLLATCRPVLMIELDERQNPGTIGRVVQRLSLQSYDGYFLSRGEFRPVAEFDPSHLQNLPAYMALPPRMRRRAEYINNFIFVPSGKRLPLRGRE